MLSFTSYTKIGLRLAYFLGFLCTSRSFIVGLIYLIMKLTRWDEFAMGSAPKVTGEFFIGASQLIFIGLIGEYILNINRRVMKRLLVVEERRINVDKTEG